MDFDLKTALPLLESTPETLRALLAGLPEPWTHTNEGPDTWSPYDVVGHLIHGERLRAMNLTDEDPARRGAHPAFGTVSMAQLLSTWVVHDLGHIQQIVRTMARQYTEAVGPWREYLSIVK